jgi:hypothetical protein
MDVVERRIHSSRKANKSWNIPMSSFFDHINGKTRSQKMGLGGVFTKVEDSTMITWTLITRECGLSVSLQQFDMKVTKLT